MIDYCVPTQRCEVSQIYCTDLTPLRSICCPHPYIFALYRNQKNLGEYDVFSQRKPHTSVLQKILRYFGFPLINSSKCIKRTKCQIVTGLKLCACNTYYFLVALMFTKFTYKNFLFGWWKTNILFACLLNDMTVSSQPLFTWLDTICSQFADVRMIFRLITEIYTSYCQEHCVLFIKSVADSVLLEDLHQCYCCCNLSVGVAFNARFTTNVMYRKIKTHYGCGPIQAIIEWLRRVISGDTDM